MADQVDPASGPRRGGRERKKVEPYAVAAAARGNGKGKGKGKAVDGEEEGDEQLSQPSDEDPDPEDDEPSDASDPESDEEESFAAPTTKKSKKPAAPPAAGAAKPKRVSTGKAPRKSTNGTAKGKGKAPAVDAEEQEDGAARPKPKGTGTGGAGDIADDNGLFNALLLPNASLPQTVEAWLDHFQHVGDEEGERGCLKELVEFVLRCCGLSNEIPDDRADDLDGVPDALDTMYDELKRDQESGAIYPLVSKHKSFKTFRASLATLLHSLIKHLSLTPLLYITSTSPPPASGPSSPLIQILVTWLNPMTSSPFRAIRHTSTFIVLHLGVALCDTMKEVEGELSAANKMKEQEVKKHGAGKKAGKEKEKREKRLKGMEDRIKECHEKKLVLEDYMHTVMAGVYVHRYRDKDPLIRTDCLKIIGIYMDKNPEEFVANQYLHYVSWAMTDPVKTVRFEAVKALTYIYKPDAPISALRTFTARCIPRLMEMSIRDIDRDVRVQAISVLSTMDENGLLSDEEEEKREQVGWLIFDKDAKVRKAVSGFVHGIWEEEKAGLETRAEELESGKKGKKAPAKKAATKKGGKKGAQPADEDDEVEDDEALAVDLEDEELKDKFVGWKSLASVLTRFTHELENLSKPKSSDPFAMDGDDESQQAGQQSQRTKAILAGIAPILAPASGHAGIAVDALWSEIDLVQDWEVLVKYLNTDHTAASIEDKVWALTEDEETFMIEVLIATLKKTGEMSKAKKVDDDMTESDITRILVKVLPKLFAKHQSETARMMEVLRLVQTLKLDMYLELRQVSAYEALWDNVTKQFFKHSDALFVEEAFGTIMTLSAANSLKTTNTSKYTEFEETLISSLRDAVGDRDIATSAFEEEDVHAAESALLRIKTVLLAKNVVHLLLEEDAELHNKPWDLILALAERGKLGYQEEAKMVEYAMRALTCTLLWLVGTLKVDDADFDDQKTKIVKNRDIVLTILEEYAVGNHTNAVDDVRRESLSCLVLLYIAFKPKPEFKDGPSLEMDDALQFRITGAVQAAIDKHRESVEELAGDAESEAESELSDEGEERVVKPKKRKVVRAIQDGAEAVGRVGEDVAFQSFIMLFIMALRTGVMEAPHSAVFLTYYGLFGDSYDGCIRDLPTILQDEGIYNGEAEMVQKVVAQAVQDSFAIFLDSDPEDAEPVNTLGLAKLLQPSFLVHGPVFKILRRLGPSAVCDFHTENITWVLQKMAGFMKAEKAAKDKRVKDRSKKKAGLCLGYFKVLSTFAAAITGRDALKVKNFLVEVLKTNDIKPAKAKTWDALHSYERRLVTLASGDSGVKAAVRKQAARPAAVAEEDAEEIDEDDEDDGVQPGSQPRVAVGKGKGKELAPPVAAASQANGVKKRAGPVLAKRYGAPATSAAAGPSNARPTPPPADDDDEDPLALTPSKRRAPADEEEEEVEAEEDPLALDLGLGDDSLNLDLDFLDDAGRGVRGVSQMSEESVQPEQLRVRKRPKRN